MPCAAMRLDVLRVRHILPGAGLMPADLNIDSMSGLVGAARQTSESLRLAGGIAPDTRAAVALVPSGGL
jgi:hypothetical protein